MTTITPELLAEIKAGCENTTHGPWRVVGKSTGYINGVDPGRKNGEVNICGVGDYRDNECLPHCRDRWDADAAHIARMAPPTTLALVAALEEARRGRDTAVKAHNECSEWLKESEAARDAALAERDALRSESEKLRAAIERTCDVSRIINDGSAYARGWNDALFSARAINNAALKDPTHAD